MKRMLLGVIVLGGGVLPATLAQTSTPPRSETPATATAPAAPPISIDPATLSSDQILANAAQLADAGQLQRAAQLIDIVIKRDERNIKALWMMGQVHEQADDLQTARNFYGQALALDKNHFLSNLGLGRIYVRQRNSTYGRQAVMYLELAEKIAPPERHAEALGLLAQAYLNADNRVRAMQTAQEARRKDNNNFDAWDVIMSVLIETGRFDEALTESLRYLDAVGKLVEAQRGQRRSLLLLDKVYQWRFQALYQYHRSLYEQLPGRQVSDRLLPGNEKKACETITQLLDVSDYQAELKRTLGYFDGIPLAERAVQYDGTNVQALVRLGRLYRQTFQDAKAARVYQKVLELEPDNAEAREALAAIGPVPLDEPPPEPAGSQPAPALLPSSTPAGAP